MTLEELNKNFEYQSDKNRYGRIEYWTEMKPDKNGKYIGDCEDYAITVKRNVPGFSKWDYYFCKTNGEGHCFLSNGEKAICNQVRTVVTMDRYELLTKATSIRKYTMFEVFVKFAYTKILKWLS